MPPIRIPQSRAGTEIEMWRERILDVAEEHFRRIGYQKTTVADIAKCLEMSTANVYRFFPSRMAINASICGRFFEEFIQVATLTACIREPAQTKLVETLTRLHQKRKATFVEERRIHDLMVVAACENWEINGAHTNEIVEIIGEIVKLGIDSGDFISEDPERDARIIMTAFTPFYHPMLVEQDFRDGNETASHLRDLIEFCIGALGGGATNNRCPHR